MSTARNLTTAVLAGAVTAAVASFAVPASAAEMEKCYGVSLKGQNDCAAGAHSCAGTATIDYDGQSFKLVPAGTCTDMETPFGPGSLEPIQRPT
ncbi:MAG: DUF2282 domain-containing protein [Bauldia sp.]|uniref:BufA1 family periplasmic bufferin-type metallophore n=1 Tax=Bauldia sp. TaxID=2575872 RepID=UPI001D7EB193|nr:DUF2282 domain-containing protein [Bauldia sp.]MCB1495272.1 DUF2282 domain-containing protein [Bauldia sp.]